HQEIIGTRFQRRHAAAMIGIVAVQVGDEWASINDQYRLSRSLNRLPPWPGTEICPWTVEGAQLLEPASRPFHQPKRMLPQAIDELMQIAVVMCSSHTPKSTTAIPQTCDATALNSNIASRQMRTVTRHKTRLSPTIHDAVGAASTSAH